MARKRSLNSDSLEEEFDMEQDVYEEKEEDCSNQEQNEILRKNIDRSNRILNRIEHEFDRGSFEPRLVEVASQMINAITNSVTQLNSKEYNDEYMLLRHRLAMIEEAKLNFKIKSSDKPNKSVTNQNIIVTDRESLLKFLNSGNTNQLEEGKNNDKEDV